MLTIRDTSTVPDGGWRYPGLNGYTITVRNYAIFYDEIVKHYTVNGQPAPSQDDVTRYVCEQLSIPCFEGNVPLVNKWTLGIPSEPARKCCR